MTIKKGRVITVASKAVVFFLLGSMLIGGLVSMGKGMGKDEIFGKRFLSFRLEQKAQKSSHCQKDSELYQLTTVGGFCRTLQGQCIRHSSRD